MFVDVELKSDSFLNQSIDKNLYCLFEDKINTIIHMIEMGTIKRIYGEVFNDDCGEKRFIYDRLIFKNNVPIINNERYVMCSAYNMFLKECFDPKIETYIYKLTILPGMYEDDESCLIVSICQIHK